MKASSTRKQSILQPFEHQHYHRFGRVRACVETAVYLDAWLPFQLHPVHIHIELTVRSPVIASLYFAGQNGFSIFQTALLWLSSSAAPLRRQFLLSNFPNLEMPGAVKMEMLEWNMLGPSKPRPISRQEDSSPAIVVCSILELAKNSSASHWNQQLKLT